MKQVFPTFGLGRLTEAELLLALAAELPNEDNTERYRRVIALGEDLEAYGMKNNAAIWRLIASAAFRLATALNMDRALMRKATHASRMYMQLHHEFTENWTWKETLSSPVAGVNDAAIKVRSSSMSVIVGNYCFFF